ncbi:MAG: TIGR02099 family protein [Gammaproteobacteria bacterium]|nr:TIGR02099 family protein [Gammaproteobacteria bacterium]
MSFIIKLFRGFWYLLWYLFAAAVVFLAAVFATARLLLPLAGDYNQDVERFAAQITGRPVKIMSLDAEWHGFSPSLVLNNVRLLSRDGSSTILFLSRARLDFDLIGMALSQQVQFKRFALSGADFLVIREKTGQINLSGFETGQTKASDDDDTAAMLHWLFSQGEISVHARNLVYQDMQKSGKRYHFSNVTFVLKNRGKRHLIDGAISFPQHSDQEFAFAIDVAGDVISGAGWSGSMYASGANLDISRIFGVLDFRGHQVNIGKSNFQLWSEWRNAGLIGLQGDLSLETVNWRYGDGFTPLLQPLLENDKNLSQETDTAGRGGSNVIEYDNFIGRFIWDRYDEGWQLIADKFVLARNSRIWPTTQFAVHYFREKGYRDRAGSRRLDVRANLIRLEDLAPVIPVLIGDYKDYAAFIAKLAPEGDVQNANFRWLEVNADFNVAARLENISFSPTGKAPGLKGLSGELRSGKHGGSLLLKTLGAEFSMPAMFRWDIPVKRLKGQVDWLIDSEHITLSSRDLELVTPHIESKAVMDLDIPRTGDPPFLSLIVHFENGEGSKAFNYFPASILKPETVKWLDAAIVQGDIISGGAIVYGPLDQFPFTKGQGVFETRFEVQNGILNYAEDWPQIHDIHANVLFRANSLSIVSDHAKVFNSTLSGTRVGIPALGSKSLELDINGKITGATQEKINYMVVAPSLYQRYGQYLSELKAGGDSDLDLQINLKIKPQFEAAVSGKLLMRDNTLEMLNLPEMLTGINGELAITHNGVTASSIKAKLLNQPGKLTVQTVQDKRKPDIKDITVRATGKFDAKQLADKYFPMLTDMVEGKSAWVVDLMLPADQDARQKRNVQLKVSSNLDGVRLNLPVPFSKAKADGKQLHLVMNIKNAAQALVKTAYGGEFEGIFEYDRGSPHLITRGEARFGGGPAVLPKTDGVRIAGNLPELSLDIWVNLFRQVSDVETSESAADSTSAQVQLRPSSRALLSAVNLEVGKFEFLRQTATNLKLLVSRKEEWLDITADSKEIKGVIRLPDALNKQYVTLDMQHLHIKTKEKAGEKIDPKELPAIKFNGRNVTYDNKQLGRVAFETSRTDNGLLLQQLVINPRETTVKGFGEWVVTQGQDQSSFEFVLESADLGATMKDLGYVETIDKGKGRVTAKLKWPAPLYDPDLAHISGDVELDFKNGRILDIEPGGAARLFGLFSIQTLPRRLTLDFSDLFSKGLGFDAIQGNFKVEDGDAYTSNFKLTGPSADVALKGRIGLGAQDYDQKVRVTPHITDAAVLLSIITAQPLLILFQQMLRQDIEGAVAVEYTLTGSWENYTLTPVLKAPSVWDDVQEF